jgi:mono/diheme cytochrome c family protein
VVKSVVNLGAPLALLVALGACGVDYPSTYDEDPVSWYGQVGQIVRTKCAGCHRPGGIAPFSLYDVDEARDEMGQMISAIDTGLMPPFSADAAPDCLPRHGWQDDPRLNGAERSAIHAWVHQGGPAGPVGVLPEPVATTLSGATVTVRPTTPFTASGDRDEFVCFLLDPMLTTSSWLTGVQVTPSVPEMVHHANVQLVAPGDAAAAIAALGGIGVPSPNCGTPPGTSIQSWLPGNAALLLRDGVGIPVPAGTLISIQVHYHQNGGSGTDATSVDLRLSDVAPLWTYELGVYGNASSAPHLLPDPDDSNGPEFVIPANKADHVETMSLVNPANLTREMRVVSVTPHMHMLGTHERATLTHPAGDTECLVDSKWNFDWQRTYSYDAAIEELPLFDASSNVMVSCHWNNTFTNPNLPRLLHDANVVAPYDVQLGLNTTDEMCLADFGIVSPTRP